MKKKSDTTPKPGTVIELDSGTGFSEAQILLLQAIDNTGSITAAARQVGISYKTAWDRIEKMNNASNQPLVRRSIGGAKGGGTTLTELGQNILTGFLKIHQDQQAFLQNLGTSGTAIDDYTVFSRSNRIKSSARNQFGGKIAKVTRGAVNTEVELELGDSLLVVATITNESQRTLKLRKNGYATALIKASWIILSTDTSISTSARNCIQGSVLRLTKGKVNSEVVLDIGNEKTLCATVTNTSAENLRIEKGQILLALFKASSVILMSS